MNRTEALEYYQKAQKRGRQNYREKTLSGQSPYLPVLDDILQNTNVEQQIPLGVMEVPLHLVVGTKTAGRTAAFASNFMPLLPQDTEFATKWISLCLAHLEDGIHDPIRCFEYMGLFYVQEGNKRVSVLKSFGADSIAAHVTRIVPRWVDLPVVRQYYEFMEAFPLTGLYTLQFTRPGSYAKLQTLLGKAPGEKWDDDDRADILSLHNWVAKAYQAHGGAHMKTTADDVLLLLMKLYPLEELKKDTPAGLAKRLDGVWDDVLAMENPAPITVSSAPAAPAAGGDSQVWAALIEHYKGPLTIPDRVWLNQATGTLEGDVLTVTCANDLVKQQLSRKAIEDVLCGVTSRHVGDAPELHAKALRLDPTGARILFAPVQALPMASSDIRTRLAAGEGCETELPEAVRAVIRREKLYKKEVSANEPQTGKGACARPLER